ncbi:armadillo repeat-containing protein 3 isoform X2 [Cynoglossus semilaevis]|uniref:Armadillo repeat containing 3 n=1 Tax=Cynoglossus semilaevis TaxID=244447 RepID=A0A3P8VFZ1_CYNSE|nr:armadillo repeat-containing protein 3 isoform X2 [Cynoglossus semilaevis]
MEKHSMAKKGKKKDSENQSLELVETVGKTPETAVLLLRSPEEDILIKACEATHAFAEKGDEDKFFLLELGALEPLCQLITHTNKLIKRYAFMALGSMVINDEVKTVLKNIDIIQSLIDNLSPEEEPVVHEHATLCLACLSVDFVHKVQIFAKDGLPPLIELLTSTDPDVQKNSLEVIFNLLEHYPCRTTAHALGVITALLELLNSEYPVIQQLTLETLQSVTTDRDSRDQFREEQGFEKIMDILNDSELNDLHAEALNIVSNCLIDTESVLLIHKDGGLIRLLNFLLVPSEPEIQSNAIKCIARVAQMSENRQLLHEQNVEKILVELLSEEDINIKTSACQAVTAMSFLRASIERIRELGAVPAVVEALHSESPELIMLATELLSNITYNNHLGIWAVFQAGGHRLLVQQLSASCPRTVANTTSIIGNMAQKLGIRNSLLAHGAMRALVEPLKSRDTVILVNVTLCVSLLACDLDARAELQSAGGLPPLVSLLRSNHREVLHNTCMAVTACARDESLAVEMCRYGALEILQEINLSFNRQSAVSKQAMVSLLNTNLSVKYSLLGHLESTDVIGDDFYDAGKARAGQRVLTLAELYKEPVGQYRPVLLINTSPEQKNDSQSESPEQKPWKMVEDAVLQSLIRKVKESILLKEDQHEQYTALARLVSEAMGGEVEREKLHEFTWVLHISELKSQLQSNVIPIGFIKKGIYCHRALLFKFLADSIGLSCTLVSGDYNRAWNEVLLFNQKPSIIPDECYLPPTRYIIDLMHQPGHLLENNSPAAVKYQTI